MANSVAHRLPYPVQGARFTLTVPFDNPDDAAETADTEISKDNGAYADATEELTIISGGDVGWLTLTGAETNCRLLIVKTDVVSGVDPTITVLQPRKLPVLLSGTAQSGSTTNLRQQAGTFPTVDNALRGCIVKTTGGTGGGGTGGANNQAQFILASNGTNGDLTVEGFETAPANDTTYEILLTEVADPHTASLRSQDDNRLNHLVKDSAVAADVANNSLWARLHDSEATADYSNYDHTARSLDAIGSQTQSLDEVDLPNVLTKLPDTLSLANINNAVIVANHLDHLIGVAATGSEVANNSLWARLHDSEATADYSNYDHTARSLEAIGSETQSLDEVDLPQVITTLGTLATAANLAIVAGYLDPEIANLTNNLAILTAYVDTEVAAIKAKTDLIPSTVDGLTPEQALQILLAPAAGEVIVDVDAGTVRIRNLQDTVDRITADVEANGNRNSIVFDHSN